MEEDMNTLIAYFTGTGNSLFIAKELSKNIQNTKIVSISKIIREKLDFPEYSRVIIVYPVYYCGLPLIVQNFFKFFNFNNCDKIYYICTSGDDNGLDCSTYKISKILNKKGKIISGGFNISMPGNYIKMHDQESQEVINKKYEDSLKKINLIVEIINANKENKKKDVHKNISFIVNSIWQKNVGKTDKKFIVSGNCNSCGICVNVCPVSNIIINNMKPKWSNHCEECLACVHFCPKQAIDTVKSINKKRYHHPQVSLNEIIQNK
jgi:ferredoxin